LKAQQCPISEELQYLLMNADHDQDKKEQSMLILIKLGKNTTVTVLQVKIFPLLTLK
jgi:hypothetical protein